MPWGVTLYHRDMVDFSTPVRMARPAFELMLARVDEAIARYDVALWLHEDYPFRSLYSVSSTAIDYSNINSDDDPQEIVNNLDQLIYFAFDDAPEEVVSSWIGEYDGDLEGEAIDRVNYARNNMPNLARLWSAKNNSIIRPLVEFGYDVNDSGSSATPRASIYIAASRIDMSDGTPDKSDIARLRVQLWPADIRVLINELNHLWQAHLSDGKSEEENGKGDEDGS